MAKAAKKNKRVLKNKPQRSKSDIQKFLDRRKFDKKQKFKVRPMLNFCFLGGVPKHGGKIEAKWCNFLRNIPIKYSYRLITHPAKYEDENTKKSKLQQYGLKKIPRKYWTPTKWATKSLVLGTLKMFSCAYSLNTKQGVNNCDNYYILVDSTCYPITKYTADIAERMKLLFNGNENISNGDQWISITEGFLQSILKSCFTCVDKNNFMDKEYWPDGIKYNIENKKTIYNNNCRERNECDNMCKRTHKFINMFLNVEYVEFLSYIGKKYKPPGVIQEFEKTIDYTTGNEIQSNVGGGAWDENFFVILSIIWKRVRNTMSPTQINNTKNGIINLNSNRDYRFTNRIFVNPQSNNRINFFNGKNPGDKLKLLNFSKQYVDSKPKIMSHVFTNWTVFSNSSPNMLRFDTNTKKFNQIITKYFDDVNREYGDYLPPEKQLPVERQYVEFIYKIYKTDGQKQPFYHPIEIYYNQKISIDAHPRHCKNDSGEYDGCFENLQDINKGTLDNLQRVRKKTYDYDEFVEEMIKTVKSLTNNNDVLKEFVPWVRAYLYMFEPNNNPPNLYDDSVLLGIAQQFKHCLFTRKIID